MKYPKTKPYRSKAFMRFCHEQGGACALCGGPFEQLHHFGVDGAMGRKPSDNEVVRLCDACHKGWDFKWNALARKSWNVLIVFCRDALELNRAYIEYLEGK